MKGDIAATEQRLLVAIEQSARRQSLRIGGMVFAIVGFWHAILFALLRIVR